MADGRYDYVETGSLISIRESVRDLMAADRAKRFIIELYRNDIEKHGGFAAKRIKAVFDAIPGQLAKREKKIVYAQVEQGSRARGFTTALTWLHEAATVSICTRSTDPSLGLALNADEASGKRYSPVSLDKFKVKVDKRVGIQYLLHTKPVKIDGDRVFLPLYMSICL